MLNHLIDKRLSDRENIDRLLLFRGMDISQVDYERIDQLSVLFSKDSVRNYEVSHPIDTSPLHKWTKSFASNRIRGNYISPKELEPFVARYIIAINRIGIKTFFSCDGWHKKSRNMLVIGFQDRNSKIWHRIVTEEIQRNCDFHINWEYNGNFAELRLPTNDECRIAVYKELNTLAEFIQKNEDFLLDAKRLLISKLKDKPKNNLPDEALYSMMFSAVVDYLKNI